jgi:hypothetical protein
MDVLLFVCGALLAAPLLCLIIGVYIDIKEENDFINREGKELHGVNLSRAIDAVSIPVEKRKRQRRGVVSVPKHAKSKRRNSKHKGTN